jgi:hypothetical protein
MGSGLKWDGNDEVSGLPLTAMIARIVFDLRD